VSASDGAAAASPRSALRRLCDLASRRASREAVLVLGGRAAVALAIFAETRILTSVMLTDLYGRYGLLNAFVALVTSFLISPIGQSMNRFVHEAARSGDMRALLRHGIGATSLVGLLGVVAILPFALTRFKDVHPTWLVAALLGTALLAGNLRDRAMGAFNTYRWRGRYAVLATADAWARMLCVAGGVVLIGGLLGAMVGLAVSAILLALAGLPWLRELAATRGDAAPAGAAFDARAMYRFARPMFLVNLLAWTVTTSDRYIVAAMQGDDALGRYVAGCKVAAAAPTIVGAVFFPVFTPILYQHMAERPDEPMRLDPYLIGLSALGSAIAGLVVVDVDGVSRLLFSKRQFDTGDAVIPWVAAGLILLSMQQIAEHQAYLIKKTKSLIFVHLSAAVANVAANVALARWLGISAPAVATFATYLLLLVVTVRVYQPSISVSSWLRVAALLAATGALVLAARAIVPGSVSVVLRAPLRWALFVAGYGLVAWPVIGPIVKQR
jgi:O-antigen/teichoic acid export membrane protein